MIKIGICDDCITDLNIIRTQISRETSQLGVKINIELFTNGKELLSYMKKKQSLQALILDIDMPEISGIQVAQVIKKQNEEIPLLFVTNREEFVFEAIHYAPFRFIRKTRLQNECHEAMQALCKRWENDIQFIELESRNEIQKVRISDILYMESKGHNIEVVLNNEKKLVRGKKLAIYEKRLLSAGFARPQVSFLVNLRHVDSIKNKCVYMHNGDEISISRNKVAEMKAEFTTFIRRQRYENP